MKEVISNNELRNVIRSASNLICDAVSSSLGPKGNNVLVNTIEEPVFITNDGVTIASSIASLDKRVNTVLEIIKEASLKTDETVGDGTTTTLVLLQKIINDGLDEIEKGKNAVVLKNELLECLEVILKEINKLKRIPSNDDLIRVASISSNDKKIGNIIFEVYSKMKNKYSIRFEESKTDETYYEIKKGYSLDIDILNMYFDNKDEIVLNNVYILILNGYLSSLNEISDIVNESLSRNKNIIVFCDDYEESILKEAYIYNLRDNKNIFVFKYPDYASRKEMIKEDISILTSSKIKDINLDNIYFSDLGHCQKVIINKEEIILINDNENIDNHLLKLKSKKINDEYEREFIEERISKLENGIATIYVGGITKTEKREKIMRFIDAINAVDIASKGVVVGEGITLLKVSDVIPNDTIGEKILKESLKVPFKKIIDNSGLNYEKINKVITDSNYNLIYNFETNNYESINDTSIIDPVNVVIESLKNACSIGSLLLTTNYLVINENLKESVDSL